VGVSISTQRRDQTAIVGVAGEVDLAAGPALETSIMSAFADQDIDTVLVDLSAVTFLDSSGISVLLKGRRVADERAVNYRVVGADGIVRKVLDLTGVWPLLSGESG
jgi:anti-anti-sigma factor